MSTTSVELSDIQSMIHGLTAIVMESGVTNHPLMKRHPVLRGSCAKKTRSDISDVEVIRAGRWYCCRTGKSAEMSEQR